MYIIRFPEEIELESHFAQTQPGALGMSLYTYRVRGIEEYFNRVKSSKASHITEIFFISPDGYFWTLIAK